MRMTTKAPGTRSHAPSTLRARSWPAWNVGFACGLLPLGVIVLLATETRPTSDALAHLHEWVAAEPSFVEQQPWRALFEPLLSPVDDAGPRVRVHGEHDTLGEYKTLGAAVAALEPGIEATIELGPGTHEAVPLRVRHLRIVGRDGAGRTILRPGTAGGNIVNVTMPGTSVVLRGLTLTGTRSAAVDRPMAAIVAGRGLIRLEGCILDGNGLDSPWPWSAALLAVDGGTIEADRCLIIANRAGLGMPAAFAMGGSCIRLSYCTVVGNVVDQIRPGFGTIAAQGARIEVTHSIVWGNKAAAVNKREYRGITAGEYSVTHSAIQGGYPGEGNTDADPSFRDPFRGDFRLRADTPVPDAGAMPLRR